MVGVSIAQAASLAKAALEEESATPSPGFVDFSTEMPSEGFALGVAEGKIGISSCRMSTENHISILDTDTLDDIVKFPITFPCTKLQFNKQDTSLFAASSDALRIWRHDAIAGIQRVAKLQTHSHAPPLTSFDWDERIALASTDGQAHVFDVEKATVISTLVVHDGSTLDIAFKPEPSPCKLATVGSDGFVKLLDTRDACQTSSLFKAATPTLRVQWLTGHEHQLAFLALDSGDIVIVDERKPLEACRRLSHHGCVPTAMDCSADFVISGCSDGRMFLFSRNAESAEPDAAFGQTPSRYGGGVDGVRLVNERTVAIVAKRVIRIFSI